MCLGHSSSTALLVDTLPVEVFLPRNDVELSEDFAYLFGRADVEFTAGEFVDL